MGYFKRLAVGWLGGFTVLMLYTLASQSWSAVTSDVFALLLLTSSGCALIASALSAAVIRGNLWAMMLLAQVITILIVGWVWHR